jgi:hypothetical protein
MLKHFQLIKLENKVHKVQSASPFLIFEFVGEVLSGIKQKTGWAGRRKSSAMAEGLPQVSPHCFRTVAHL